MSRTRLLSIAAAAAAILSLPALAIGATAYQAASPDGGTAQATDQSTVSSPAPAAPNASVNASATVLDNSQVAPDQAQALKTGDNTLVTNGPVPDTPANRAKYGRPMSNAGKRTAPVGN
jgi:hypothetical protein